MRFMNFRAFRSLHRTHKPLNRLVVMSLICVVAFLGIIISLNAEIYKWRDETGLIYYSNHPPSDPSRILEIIPSQNASPASQGEDKVYYLAVPGGQGSDSFTVPPQVLQELFNQQPQAVAQTQSLPSEAPDMTALTMRLAEVEQALQREIETRLRWEYQYAQAQSVIKALQAQNRTLNIALASMEDDINQLRGTVIASDMQVTALKQRTLPDQYAMLETKVTGIQDHVETITQELDTLDALALSNKVAALADDVHALKNQQQPDDTVQLRLASLESDMQNLAETSPLSYKATEEVARLERHGKALADITNYHDKRLDDHLGQIASLEVDLELLKASQTPSADQLKALDDDSRILAAQLMENNKFMEAIIKRQAGALQIQNAQIKAIQAQLRSLQAQEIAEPKTAGGIRITPRVERRRTSLASRMISWLTKPRTRLSGEE